MAVATAAQPELEKHFRPAISMASNSNQAPLRVTDRFAAAAGASLVAAFVVNPLDVVKTRMQAQAAAATGTMSESQRSLYEVSRRISRSAPERFVLHTSPSKDNTTYRWSDRRWGIAHCPAQCVRQAPRASASSTCAPTCTTYTSMGDAFQKIMRQEGLTALWRGTSTSLLMSVPMVGIYMPLYDFLLAGWHQAAGPYTPMLAGSASRLLAVFCVAPFELVRTRLQAAHAQPHPQGRRLSALQAAKLHAPAAAAAATGAGVGRPGLLLRQVAGLWTGVTATLLRDVPFSALYWGMLEPMRQALLPQDAERASHQQLLLTNMAAGGAAGALAAGITTPFDVVKTRMQLSAGAGSARLSAWQTLRQVQQSQGLAGLFTGLGPRATRAAPACAIVISCYELLKSTLSGSHVADG